MTKINLENQRSQMRKGFLEFCTLLIISRGRTYATDIINELKTADLIVVEGTLYPLLSRLRQDGLLGYDWEESVAGPPRKYYHLTVHGETMLSSLRDSWQELNTSINKLIKQK